MDQPTSGAIEKRGGYGCCGCRGCFIALVALVAAVAVIIWQGPALLRAVGLAPPGAEELFSGSPDPIGTEAVNSILESAGVAGAEAIVIPIAGTADQIAIFTVDASVTTGGPSSIEEADAFLTNIMGQLAEANSSGNLAIKHVSVDYVDESGESLVALTAPQAAIEAYANGSISRREFLSQVEIDLSKLITAAELREFAEEVR